MEESTHDAQSAQQARSPQDVSPDAESRLARDRERVRALAEKLARAMGLSVWGLELVSGGPGRTSARLYVEAEGAPPGVSRPVGASGLAHEADADSGLPPLGVSIEDLARLSRALSEALDAEEAENPDFLPGAYELEVSSPGLSRRFFAPEQLSPYVGETLFLDLTAPHTSEGGRKRFKGELTSVVGDRLTLTIPDLGGQSLEFDWPLIKKAKLDYRFEAAPESGKPRPGKAGFGKDKAGRPPAKKPGKAAKA